jgi:hypothetical protein
MSAKNIDWVKRHSNEEIEKMTDLELLDLSIQKWKNYKDCNLEQLEMIQLGTKRLDPQDCALCRRFSGSSKCKRCPLKKSQKDNCFDEASVYKKSWHELEKISRGYKRFEQFKITAINMHAALVKTRKELVS